MESLAYIETSFEVLQSFTSYVMFGVRCSKRHFPRTQGAGSYNKKTEAPVSTN